MFALYSHSYKILHSDCLGALKPILKNGRRKRAGNICKMLHEPGISYNLTVCKTSGIRKFLFTLSINKYKNLFLLKHHQFL